VQNDTAGITIVRNHNVLARPRIPKDPGSVRLGEVEEGSVPDAGEVYTEYLDPQRGTWASVILPVLKSVAARAICKQLGCRVGQFSVSETKAWNLAARTESYWRRLSKLRHVRNSDRASNRARSRGASSDVSGLWLKKTVPWAP
jgi:hypothetical protein